MALEKINCDDPGMEIANLDDCFASYEDYERLGTVFARLQYYCTLKKMSMKDRDRGKLATAIRCEEQMQETYDSLPDWARW